MEFVIFGGIKMKALILKNCVIENIIIVESLDDFPGCISYIDGANIGDKVINNELIKTEVKRVVPEEITPMQAELQLLSIGLLDDVLELVKLDREAYIYWSRATRFIRQDPILLKMSAMIGMSSDDLDTLFIEASQL